MIIRQDEDYIDISLCIDEMIRNSWKILDYITANMRSRLKSMTIIKECYKHKTEIMFRTEEAIRQIKDIYQQMILKDKKLTKREKSSDFLRYSITKPSCT